MTSMDFWFEFASTYSYLAVEQIGDKARAAGVRVNWRPFLLGPIFAAQGWNDSPFNLYPAKGQYMWRDMERLTASHGLPFKKPSVFPRSGLLAARLTLVGLRDGWGESFARAVYRANFADDQDITEAETLSRLVADVGAAPEPALTAAASPAIKEQLKEQTARALSLGIFGAPSFVVGTELFWGQDRMDQAFACATRQS